MAHEPTIPKSFARTLNWFSNEQATERGFEKTVQWLEQVGDEVYAQAARGEFVAGDEV